MNISDGEAAIAALTLQAEENAAQLRAALEQAREFGVDSKFIDDGYVAIEGGAVTRDELLKILDHMIIMQLTVADLSSAALLSNLKEGADSLRAYTGQIKASVQMIAQFRRRAQEERQSYAEMLSQMLLDMGDGDGGT